MRNQDQQDQDLSPVARLGNGSIFGNVSRPEIKPYFGGPGKIVAADKDGNVPPGFKVESPGGVPMVAKVGDHG